MKKILAEIFGDGPWEYESRAGRVMITAMILVNTVAYLVLIVKLAQLGRMMLG